MSLNKKEKLFCDIFLKTGSYDEARKMSGLNQFEYKKDVYKEIIKIYNQKKKTSSIRAKIGYERLAFGSISDALKLMLNDKISTADLNKMDLFCISEIKKIREGTIEIKFFDRMRALEKLEKIDDETTEKLQNFYKKLEKNTF